MYYLYLKGAAYGPYTEDQVRAMIATGAADAKTLVFKDGGVQQWLPASSFPVLMRPPAAGAAPPVANPTVTSIPLGHHTEVERTVWEGRPSAWTMFGALVRSLLLVLTVIVAYVLIARLLPATSRPAAALIAAGLSLVVCAPVIWTWLRVKTTVFTLTTERFTYAFGVLSRQTENLELYRVKDFTVRQPFWLRLLGLGYVDVTTSDVSDRKLLQRWPSKSGQPGVGAIRKPQDVAAMFRKYAERHRQRRGVREIDVT